jgi:hypothetical protein
MLLQFSSVNKLKEEFDVQISVPNESSHSDQIRLEGKKENVEKVREAIADIVTKQEKKTQEEDEKRKKAATSMRSLPDFLPKTRDGRQNCLHPRPQKRSGGGQEAHPASCGRFGRREK